MFGLQGQPRTISSLKVPTRQAHRERLLPRIPMVFILKLCTVRISSLVKADQEVFIPRCRVLAAERTMIQPSLYCGGAYEKNNCNQYPIMCHELVLLFLKQT